MSVSSHDAFPEIHGTLLTFDAPADDVTDPTEDLAEEITSELASASPIRAEPPALHAVAVGDSTGHVASGDVLRERYVLETRLGGGGTAMVFRAVDLRRDAAAPEGHHVALKLLRPELRDRPDCIARLQREFRQTQAVAHPNVVRFHDLDCDRGAWFIVMELLSGQTLGRLLRRVAPSGLTQVEALDIAASIGDALVLAHGRGVVHGDVKPGNIYLAASGPPRLLDFGVAPESPTADSPGHAESRPAAAATRAYASPEVLAGEVPAPADDVFSLACVTYEMLTGVHPYGRQSRDVAARSAVAPSPIASLDVPIAATLLSALDLRRGGRPSMAQLVASFRGVVQQAVATTPELSPAITPVVPLPAAELAAVAMGRRSRVPLWGVVAAGIMFALAIGILIGRSGPESAQAAGPPAPERVAADTSATQEAHGVMAPAVTEARPVTTMVAGPVTGAAVAQPAKGAELGLVSFDSSMMVVSKRAVVAAIPLRHFSHARRATQVTWRIVDGTARAGRDYGGPATGVENFVEGNTFRILYVPILPDSRGVLDRSFAVELTGASQGTEVGPTQRIEVTILGTA